MFVIVAWAGGPYGVNFLKKKMLVLRWVVFSKIIILFANGVGVGKCHFCRHPKKVRCRKWR